MFPTGPRQTAIELDWPRIESCFLSAVFIRNVVMAPGNGYAWANGIYLRNAWSAQLSGINFVGPGGVPEPQSDNGIILDGDSNDVGISHYTCAGAITGLYLVGQCEGARLTNFSIIGGYFGVVSQHVGSEPGLQISNGHINATLAGVNLQGDHEVALSDLLIFGGNYNAGSKGSAFYAVNLNHCQEVDLRGVRVSSLDPAKPLVPLAQSRTANVRGTVQVLQHMAL